MNKVLNIIGILALLFFIYVFISEKFDENNSMEHGYEWARENNIKTLEECSERFDVGSLSEDGCSEYIKEMYGE